MSAADAKEKKPKKEKAAAPAPAEAAAPAAPTPPPAPPRAPADPRLKVWKKFQGRFLPKGPLRDRLKEVTTRWNATEDHSGVTVEELKALLADWRASREKGPAAKKLKTAAKA